MAIQTIGIYTFQLSIKFGKHNDLGLLISVFNVLCNELHAFEGRQDLRAVLRNRRAVLELVWERFDDVRLIDAGLRRWASILKERVVESASTKIII